MISSLIYVKELLIKIQWPVFHLYNVQRPIVYVPHIYMYTVYIYLPLELSNCIAKYTESGYILITGDFNARTGSLQDYIQNDSLSFEINDHISEIMCYISDAEPGPRCMMDKKINTFGRRLISICKSSHVRIVNGRHQFDPLGVLLIVGQMDDRLSTYFLQIHSSIYRTLTLAILRNSRTKLLSTFSSSVRLETETKRPLSLPNTSATVVKWKEQLETQMRRDLISNLDSLYSCVVEGTDVN